MSIGNSKGAHHNPYGPSVALPSSEVDLSVFWFDITVDPDTLEPITIPGLSFHAYWISKTATLPRSLANTRPPESRFGFSGLYADCINLGDKGRLVNSWDSFWAAASTDEEKLAYASWLAVNTDEGGVSFVVTQVMVRSLVVVGWSSKLPPTRVFPHGTTHKVRVPMDNNVQVADFTEGVPVISNSPQGRALKISLIQDRPKLSDLCKLIKEKIDRRGYNSVLDPLDQFVNNPFGINDADQTGT